jgi:hypothetical protein
LGAEEYTLYTLTILIIESESKSTHRGRQAAHFLYIIAADYTSKQYKQRLSCFHQSLLSARALNGAAMA